MNIKATEDLLELKGLRLGYLVFELVRVEKSNPVADAELEDAIGAVRSRFASVESIPDDAAVKGIRSLFRRVGLDPTKERPSGEALIRRAVSGQGLYRVNTVVDINNAVSLRSGFPCGVYDKDRIIGDIAVAVGKEGEAYEGIGGKMVNACGRLLTRDSISIFGAPTADSRRTCVTLETKRLLMLIYSFDAPEGSLESAMENAKKAMESATGGRCVESGCFEIR